MSGRPHRTPWRSLAVAAAAALCLVASGTGGTRSGWANARTDTSGSAVSGSVAFTHTYPSTSCSVGLRTAGAVSCTGSIAPTSSPTPTGVSASDAITDNGTTPASGLQADVAAASGCGPVGLVDRRAATNPMLPRYGTTFHTSGGPMDSAGYVTLDGATGYATSVVQTTQPGATLTVGTLSGVGVWFKAAAGTSGPLFSFAASASNGGGSSDRALFIDANGKLNLTWNLALTKLGPTASTYTDNLWHFAYVTFGGINVALVGLIPQVTLYVDGVQQTTTPLLSLVPLDSYAGYWHLGWAPTSVTGLGSAYGAVSLSNFVVINAGSVPDGTTIGKPATQAAFNSATSGSTDHWILNDSGTSTYTGALPTTLSSPCTKVNLDWSFTSPSGTAASAAPLATFADGTWHSVPAPGPGGTQTSTLTVRQGSGYSTDLAGVHLYAPLSYRVQTVPTGSPWSSTFTWAGADAAFIA